MKNIPFGRALLPVLALIGVSAVHADFDQYRKRTDVLFGDQPTTTSASDSVALSIASQSGSTGGAELALTEAGGSVKALPKSLTQAPYMTIVDEAILPGSVIFRYPYPMTPPPGMTDKEHRRGKSAMQLIFTPKAWSGMQVSWGGGKDFSKLREKGAISFWVKGSKCGLRQCWGPFEVGLMDDGKFSGGRQLRAFVNASNYGTITDSTWTHMVVPIKALGFEGSYWDDGLSAKVQNKFNWAAVTSFTLDAADNNIEHFTLFFDDVQIIKDKGPK